MNKENVEKRINESEAYKKLLVDMESIIGNSCYNGNIQNYGPGGYWEGEGRWFRYPITFLGPLGEKDKRSYGIRDIDPSKFATGYYAFGANRLSIVAALARIIEYLEENHNLEIE